MCWNSQGKFRIIILKTNIFHKKVLCRTKVYCKEGGCGLCTVHVECFDSGSKEHAKMSVDSVNNQKVRLNKLGF